MDNPTGTATTDPAAICRLLEEAAGSCPELLTPDDLKSLRIGWITVEGGWGFDVIGLLTDRAGYCDAAPIECLPPRGLPLFARVDRRLGGGLVAGLRRLADRVASDVPDDPIGCELAAGLAASADAIERARDRGEP